MKMFDVISLPELSVEFFRTELDIPFSKCSEMIGPFASAAPAIFADTFAKLGGKVAYLGTVGEDEFADCVLNKLSNDGVDVSRVVRLKGTTTGTAFTNYYSDGSRKFIFHVLDAAPGKFCCEHLDEEYLKSSRWLHISGNALCFGEETKKAVMRAVDIACDNNIPISFDPNLRLEIMSHEDIENLLSPVLLKTTMFLPSRGEMGAVTGISDEESAVSYLLNLGIKIIIKKDGELGCSIFTEKDKISVPAFTDIIEVDPTGCGDSFAAAAVQGYMQGMPLYNLGLYANAVGAIAATKKGLMEAVESQEQVNEFLKTHGFSNIIA